MKNIYPAFFSMAIKNMYGMGYLYPHAQNSASEVSLNPL